MKLIYMSWFSSGEGSKIHANEFTHAMEELGNEIIKKDLSLRTNNANSSAGSKEGGSQEKTPFTELKSFVLVFTRFLRLFYYMLKHRPDGIIYRYSIYDISALLIGKIFRKPVVYEINGSIKYERDLSNKYYIKSLVSRTEEKIFGESDLVVLVSDELKKYFSSLGYDVRNTIVVPNGVDMSKFNNSLPLPKHIEEYRVNWADKKVIGFLGSLKSWHGAERIIDLLPDILDKEPDTRFLIIGDGDGRSLIESKIREFNLGEFVFITGFQDYELIPSILDIADITVAPYHNIDFFHFSPLKVIEYMAKGKPVIAPALGQCVDLISDDNGILLKENTEASLERAILKLLKEPDLAKKMGQTAKLFIEKNYTWEKNAKRIEEAITTNYGEYTKGR